MQWDTFQDFAKLCKAEKCGVIVAEMAQVELQVEFEEKNIIKMIITKKKLCLCCIIASYVIQVLCQDKGRCQE